MARDSGITFFKKNALLIMHLFWMLFSLQIHEAPTMVGLKCFKQYGKVRFVSIFYSRMLSIRKLTYFKWKTIAAVFNVNGGVKLYKDNALSKIPIFYVVYQFLKWMSFCTIWWYLLSYSSIAFVNTITHLLIFYVLHSLHFAANIF